MIDLKLTIKKLEEENLALRTKMTLLYSNWSYDYKRFIELKEKCINDKNESLDDDIIEKSTIRRSIASNNLRLI